jgi:branched-chain amino acid transport system ATP-binding protein
MMPERKTLLEIQQIHTFYGLSHVLFGLSLEVKEGEIVALLGRNGAGKTTAIRSIVGLTPPSSGKIFFLGEDLTKVPAYMITRKGIGVSFSERRVFANLTVKENLEIGYRAPLKKDMNPWGLARIYEIFPDLKRLEKQWARTLSGGQQQMLSVGKALMANPELLILDEPTTGLSPIACEVMGKHIDKLRKEGVSVLLAEQDVNFAMGLGDRCYIIDTGEVQFQGTFKELSMNEKIVREYLTV